MIYQINFNVLHWVFLSFQSSPTKEAPSSSPEKKGKKKKFRIPSFSKKKEKEKKGKEWSYPLVWLWNITDQRAWDKQSQLNLSNTKERLKNILKTFYWPLQRPMVQYNVDLVEVLDYVVYCPLQNAFVTVYFKLMYREAMADQIEYCEWFLIMTEVSWH